MSLKIFLIALACLSVCGVAQAADDCFNEAAAYQGVNPWVLRALAWYESKGDRERDTPERKRFDRRGSVADQLDSFRRPRARRRTASRADRSVRERVRGRLAAEAENGQARQYVARDRRLPLGNAKAARCLCAGIQKVLVAWGQLPTTR